MAVPVVLDRVVCASIAERLRNLRPLTTMCLVKEKECLFLSLTPLALFEERVKVVMPSLSALLSAPAFQHVRYLIPVSSAMHIDYLHEAKVLIRSPHILLGHLHCSASFSAFLFPLHGDHVGGGLSLKIFC